jgi:hypothetical protein
MAFYMLRGPCFACGPRSETATPSATHKEERIAQTKSI